MAEVPSQPLKPSRRAFLKAMGATASRGTTCKDPLPAIPIELTTHVVSLLEAVPPSMSPNRKPFYNVISNKEAQS